MRLLHACAEMIQCLCTGLVVAGGAIGSPPSRLCVKTRRRAGTYVLNLRLAPAVLFLLRCVAPGHLDGAFFFLVAKRTHGCFGFAVRVDTEQLSFRLSAYGKW
jgi:hypothetical protein